MRLSSDAQKLAELKYIQGSQEISSKHYANIERCERTMPRGGAMKRAIDNEHLQMMHEIANLYLESHLEVFIAEDSLPDANDMRELLTEVEKIVKRHEANEFWTPRASTGMNLTFLPQRIFSKFANRVKQLELEAKIRNAAPRPPASTTYNTTIHGDNYGNIQHGGEGNTQTINRTDDET